MSNLWRGLEEVDGLAAVPAVWRASLGRDFDAFQRAFARHGKRSAKSVPCLRECGCAHAIVRQGDGSLVGVCRCEPWNCDDLRLTAADVEVWEVNLPRLGRAVAKAWELDAKEASLGISGARQIASFGASALPVVLVVCGRREQFHGTVVELVARLRERFVVLTPTSRWWDVQSKEALEGAKAGVFDMETQMTVMAHGTLHARQPAGELFGRFLAETGEPVAEDVARQAFALIRALDSETKRTKAPVLRVFRLYCMEGKAAEEVANLCACSKGTIINRLDLIRRKTGTDPEKLRAYSNQFEKVEDALREPNANRIHRKSLLDAPEDKENELD